MSSTTRRESPAPTAGSKAATFTRLIQDGFARGDASLVEELISPDFIEHQFGLEASGPRALRHLMRAITDVHTSMPDVTYSIDLLAEDVDRVWACKAVRGNDTGGGFGHSATGPSVGITVMDIARFEHALMVEYWGVPDRSMLLVQLGHLGSPRTTPAPAGVGHGVMIDPAGGTRS